MPEAAWSFGSQTSRNGRRSEEQYRRFSTEGSTGVFQTTPQGRFLMANPALARMLRYDSTDDLLSTITDSATQGWVVPEDRSRFVQAIEEQGVVRGLAMPPQVQRWSRNPGLAHRSKGCGAGWENSLLRGHGRRHNRAPGPAGGPPGSGGGNSHPGAPVIHDLWQRGRCSFPHVGRAGPGFPLPHGKPRLLAHDGTRRRAGSGKRWSR